MIIPLLFIALSWRNSIYDHFVSFGSIRSIDSDSRRSSPLYYSTEQIDEINKLSADISKRLEQSLDLIDIDQTKKLIENLDKKSEDPTIWQDELKSKDIMKRLNNAKSTLARVESWKAAISDSEAALDILKELAAVESSIDPESEALVLETKDSLTGVIKDLDTWDLERLLSGPYDDSDCRMLITAGVGGTDAQDWAEMLARMYSRYCEFKGYKHKFTEWSDGEGAGIRSAELEVQGHFAYGYLKNEKGAHRLVRQSPFNAAGKRQTSFAGIEVLPILDEAKTSMEIPEDELEVTTMRSGGKGGQNVNKVESGVRVRHIPTGITVKCTTGRAQLSNKKEAMQRLKEKLLAVAEEMRVEELSSIRGDAVEAEWGQQIRNYVLHPYSLVKDTKTGLETSNVNSVLDGGAGLDMFVIGSLRNRGKEAADLAEMEREIGKGIVD